MSETVSKKKGKFSRVFWSIIRALFYPIMLLIFSVAYIFVWPFERCKVVGKENLRKDDEAPVFIANHYELYGPVAVFFNFPFKFRPWIIDKMMNPEDIEKQMGLMIYNNFKFVPRFLKTFLIKCIKAFVVFIMKFIAKGIPVSRENLRSNIETMKISSEELEKHKAIIIWPELWYVKEGVGEFQKGFEHLAKFHYKKTGKRVSFYPMFISKKNKTMYIGKPIVFDPEKDENAQKDEVVTFLHDAMIAQYEEFELKKIESGEKTQNT